MNYYDARIRYFIVVKIDLFWQWKSGDYSLVLIGMKTTCDQVSEFIANNT
jgi:hypothetical protein